MADLEEHFEEWRATWPEWAKQSAAITTNSLNELKAHTNTTNTPTNMNTTPKENIVDHVHGGPQAMLIERCHAYRAMALDLETRVRALKQNEELAQGNIPSFDSGECIANIVLAIRHIEDACMRLGKVIQARDGGASQAIRERADYVNRCHAAAADAKMQVGGAK